MSDSVEKYEENKKITLGKVLGGFFSHDRNHPHNMAVFQLVNEYYPCRRLTY